MRVVVTGAAGFVGSHLCERLVREDHDVVAIDAMLERSSGPRRMEENVRALDGESRVAFHRLDLRDAPLDSLLDGADAIVHLAAMPGLPVSWQDLELYVGCNILATGRLIDAARRVGTARFVHVSTSSVYGRFAVGDEQQPVRPVSPYGLTKLAAEHLLLAHHESFGFPVVILRYFSIYGPRQRPDMAYHLFFESVLDGRPIVVYGDGTQARSNTYVDDCVEATVRALDRGRVGEAYNVGGGEMLVLRDAIALIGELVGREPFVIHEPERAGDQQITQADTTKAGVELGYVPRIGAREGLARQLDWHLARRATSASAALQGAGERGLG